MTTYIHNKKHSIDSTTDHTGVSGAVTNNIITFDANGLPQDSGSAISDLTGHIAASNPHSLSAASGANTDITGLTGLIGNITMPNSIVYNTNPTIVSHVEGTTHWNPDYSALEVVTDLADISLVVGHQMFKRVRNETGVTIEKGKVVRIQGTPIGDVSLVVLAASDTEATSIGTIGMVVKNINDGQTGYIVTNGTITGVSTVGATPGATIFLSDTAGEWTEIFPDTPQHLVVVGKITKAASNGIIEISIDNGFEISELHDCLITSIVDGQILEWDAANSYWKNVTQVHAASAITSGTFADARISQSSVTQHVGAIDHNSLLNTHNLTTDIDHNSTTNYTIGQHRVINDGGTSGTELWSANKINAVTSAISTGIVHRAKVINKVDNTTAPPTEVSGDRYILDETGGGVHVDWDGASANDIVQFNGTIWEATTPSEGWMTFSDIGNANEMFIDDGTPQWQTQVAGVGDMLSATYDPLGVSGDAFNMDNMAEGTAKILTATERTNISSNTTHSGLANNPHTVTATQVNLGNVTNESKATMFTSPTFTTNVVIPEVAGVADYDKFLVTDSGTIKTRTGNEVLGDIGAAASSHTHNYLSLTDTPSSYTAGYSPVINQSGTGIGFIPRPNNGFTDLTESVVTYDNITRTLTIAPSASEFDVEVLGKVFAKTSENVAHADTEGVWYFYYNSSGVLTTSQTKYDLINVAPIAYGYWDTTNKEMIQGVSEDRHSRHYLPLSHRTTHDLHGLSIENSGFDIVVDTTGNGSNNLHAQMALTNAEIHDEDLEVDIVRSATPTNNFEQEIGVGTGTTVTTPGRYMVLYRSGASGNLRVKTVPIITAQITISSSAVDNSFNDSGSGFAGIVAGDWIRVSGYTGGDVVMNGSHLVVSATTSKVVVDSTLLTAVAGDTVSIVDFVDDYPIIQDGTAGFTGSGRIAFNDPDGGGAGIWGLTELGDNNHMAIYPIATMFKNPGRVISILIGQREDSTQALAEENNTFQTLTIPSFTQEERGLYRLIVNSKSSFSNSVKARIVSSTDIRETSIPGGSGASVGNHASLTNLSYGVSGHIGFVASGGVSGGQTIIGSTVTAEDLTLQDNAVDGNSVTVTQLVGAVKDRVSFGVIGASGGVIVAGKKAPRPELGNSGTFTRWTMISTVAGVKTAKSIKVQILINGTNISGTDSLYLNAASEENKTSFTGWTLGFSANDEISFEVLSSPVPDALEISITGHYDITG